MRQALRSILRLVFTAPASASGLSACGRIAAGIPLEAVEDTQRAELLAMLTGAGRYALQVGDDSMCEAGILAGDIVVVQSQQQACNGDIVVALLDDAQVVLKRLRFRADDRICLLADNADERDQLVEASRLLIQGRVIGQIRRYT